MLTCHGRQRALCIEIAKIFSLNKSLFKHIDRSGKDKRSDGHMLGHLGFHPFRTVPMTGRVIMANEGGFTELESNLKSTMYQKSHAPMASENVRSSSLSKRFGAFSELS